MDGDVDTIIFIPTEVGGYSRRVFIAHRLSTDCYRSVRNDSTSTHADSSAVGDQLTVTCTDDRFRAGILLLSCSVSRFTTLFCRYGRDIGMFTEAHTEH